VDLDDLVHLVDLQYLDHLEDLLVIDVHGKLVNMLDLGFLLKLEELLYKATFTFPLVFCIPLRLITNFDNVSRAVVVVSCGFVMG
jgi:hypothetical protein